MKVIGESKDDVVVMMTKDELAKLAGFQCVYSMQERGKRIEPGSVFNVGEMFESAMDTLKFYKEAMENFKRTQGAIKRLMEFIEPEKKA
jgi:hypothetical protein